MQVETALCLGWNEEAYFRGMAEQGDDEVEGDGHQSNELVRHIKVMSRAICDDRFWGSLHMLVPPCVQCFVYSAPCHASTFSAPRSGP